MRDSQRQKVYDAEGRWWRERPSEWVHERGSDDTSELQALYELLAEETGAEVPPFTINHRLSAWAGITYRNRIEFHDGVSMLTALHEFAHWMDHGHKHGWKFAENMIRLVGIWYGDAEAEALKAAYAHYGVTWHEYEALARERKAKAARERRYERHGERGAVYVLARVLPSEKAVSTLAGASGELIYRCEGLYYSYYLSQAKTWRRRATAERHAQKGSNQKYSVMEAEGEFDAYENRWYAKSLVDSPQRLVVPV